MNFVESPISYSKWDYDIERMYEWNMVWDSISIPSLDKAFASCQFIESLCCSEIKPHIIKNVALKPYLSNIGLAYVKSFFYHHQIKDSLIKRCPFIMTSNRITKIITSRISKNFFISLCQCQITIIIYESATIILREIRIC